MANKIHTEIVKGNGKKARWPYDTTLPNAELYNTVMENVKAQKQGSTFIGWKYNGTIYREPFDNESSNPFGPITQNANIFAVWDKLTIHGDTNHSIIGGEGDSESDLTKLYTWITDGSGNVILDNIFIEEVPLDDGMQRIVFEDRGTAVENNRNITKKKAVANDVNIPKYYRFKAKTNSYGGLESDVIEIEQAGADQTVLPDFDFLTFKYSWGENDGTDLDTATYIVGTDIILENGYYIHKTYHTLKRKEQYEELSEEEKMNYEPLTLDYYPVGFDCLGVMDDKDYHPGTEETPFQTELMHYIKGGGDNTSSGNESALINWKEICNRDFITQGITKIYCKLYANWYRLRKNGNCSVTFQTWKTESGNGSMKLDRDSTGKTLYTFSPTGDTQLKNTVVKSGNVYASSVSNHNSSVKGTDNDERRYYSHVITLTYDIRSKSAIISDSFNQTEKGRNLRFDCTINDINQNNDGSTSYSFNFYNTYNDLSSKTYTFYKKKLFINGIGTDVQTNKTDEKIIETINWYKGETNWLDFISSTRDSEGNIISLTFKPNRANNTNEDWEADISLQFNTVNNVSSNVLIQIFQKKQE